MRRAVCGLWMLAALAACGGNAPASGPRALTRNSFMRQTRNYVRKVLLFYRSDVSEFRRGPRLASRGEVAGGNPLLALGCLIIPGVSVVGHGYVLLRLLSVV